MINPSRLATWPFLAGFYLLYMLLAYLGNAYFFGLPFLESLYRASSGLVHPTLVLNLLWTSIFACFFLGLGHFKRRDFGLTTSLRKGVIYTVLLWLLIQGAVLFWQLVSGGTPRLRFDLSKQGTYILGFLLSQLLGNALFEEAVWRGFLLPQLFYKFTPKFRRFTLSAAITVSAGAFTLMHLPVRIFGYRDSPTELLFWLVAIFLMALIFTLVFLRSKNLYVAVGFHALFNRQALIVAVPAAGSLRSDLTTDALAVGCGLLLLLMFKKRSWS